MAQTINVDITPGLYQPTLYYHQNDVGRAFGINVQTKDGFEIPAGATALIQATKPSGLGFTVAGSINGSLITFASTEEMTDEWGRFPAQLQIANGGTVIYAANFILEGQKNVHPDGTTDGQKGSIIPELTLLVERIEAAADSIHELNVTAHALDFDEDPTATYNSETNTIDFGIPNGERLSATDDNSDGNVVITFS